MKHVLKYFLFFFFVFPETGFAQHRDEELLDWSSSRKLRWDDFKARPEPEENDVASTTTYLGIEYYITSSHFSYKIQSRFSKTLSWGLHKTAYILSHEQGHFDIAEIFARRLNMKMSVYRFNKRTYQRDLNKIYNDILEEKEKMQNNYDKETNHSINKVKQAAWLKKIAAMLEEYKDFAGY